MKMLINLAWRNLWRKKRRTFITVSSVLFATILAILLMSLVSGAKNQMVDSLLRNSTGFLQIQDVLFHDEPSMDHALEYGDEVESALAANAEDIHFTVPRIQGFCLASRGTASRGAILTGIVSEKEDKMNNLSANITEGAMFGPGDGFAVVAEGLAMQLGLGIGDTIVLLGQGFQGMTAAGQYRVGGIIRFLMPEQNNAMVYLPLHEAQWFFAAPDRLTNLVIMVEDEGTVNTLAENLRAALDPEWFAVLTWEELMPDFLVAFEARDAQMKIFAWILYIVVGFGIFGTIVTMVYERLREFGILLSIGLKRFQLAVICLLETLMISFMGVIIGMLIGFPIIYSLYKRPIGLSGELADVMIDMGVEPAFSFALDPGIFLYQGMTVFLIALFVGIYPVQKVFRLKMVNASR
jgi:putative ABC transport system permease protein